MLNPNNITILRGYLGRDPELKEYKNTKGETGHLVKLSVATSRTGEGTDWHDVTFFGKTAEIIDKFCIKGSQLLIVGEMQYTVKDGDDGKKRKFSNVRGEAFAFCDSKDSPRGQQNEAAQGDDWKAQEEDIPF